MFLKDSNIILSKANQALQTLEKYTAVLDRVVSNLNLLEFQDLASLSEVVTAVQRSEMVMRIVGEIERYICELGNEGRLISMQLNELVKFVETDQILIMRDYCPSYMDYNDIYKQLQGISSEEILDLNIISKLLGYSGFSIADTFISPRGYRILGKIPRIPVGVIENLVKNFKDLKAVIEASNEELDKVEGIGEARAKAIKNGLRRLKEKIILDKQD